MNSDFSNIEILIYSLLFLFSCSLTTLLVPFVSKFGSRYSLFDKPDERKQHIYSVVRIGGFAIIFAVLLVIISSTFFINKENLLNLEDLNNHFLIVTIFGGVLFYLIGLLDDIYNISPFYRLLFQFTVSTFIWSQGIVIDSLYIPGFNQGYYLILIPKILSLIFTSIWIIGVTNAINWMDGLDGLASGITSITCIAIFGISISSGDFATAIISASLSGACLGFIFYNRNPSFILMGDGGSNFIGFMLSILTLSVSYTGLSSDQIFKSSNIFLLVGILLMPIIDMISVILKRMSLGKSPFYPDRNHFHHTLLNAGNSHKHVVHIMHLITTIILVIIMIFLKLDKVFVLLTLSIFTSILFFIEIFYKLKIAEKG